MQLKELKVKYKTLAAESQFIRLEERKACEDAKRLKWKQKAEAAARKEATWNSLYRHRKDVVRPEARAAYIARAYLVGKPFEKVEQKWFANSYAIAGSNPTTQFELFWDKVVHNVTRFSSLGGDLRASVLEWRDKHPLIAAGNPLGLPLPVVRKRKPRPVKKGKQGGV